MGAVSLMAWERFYKRVVARGGEWPRALWFAAVEDGLKGALPENCGPLTDYRRGVAELKQLEGAPTRTYQDAQRVAQLEADIMRLIGHTDKAIRERAGKISQHAKPTGPPPTSGRRDRSGVWRSALVLGVLLFCGILLGATYYQNRSMTERMERELAALQQRLLEETADQRAALEARIRSVDGERQNLDALQAELSANVAAFNEVMSESARSITALSDRALGDLASGLADRDTAVDVGLGEMRARSASLERGLDQAEEGLATLAARLPELASGMDRLAAQLQTTAADFERAAGQVETIKAQVPEIALWLEGQRQGVAQKLALQQQTVDELDVEIATLSGVLDQSRGELSSFRGTLEQDLTRAKQQGDALERALADMRATERQATELLSQFETNVQTTQSELQGRIDAILSDVAAAADLAVRRSDDVTKRAEAEAAGRLQAATEQAIAGLTEARQQHLAELSRWAAATQTELAETRAGLSATWRGMDDAVAERQSRVLARLDEYAATLEGRVRELLEALDVIVARSSG